MFWVYRTGNQAANNKGKHKMEKPNVDETKMSTKLSVDNISVFRWQPASVTYVCSPTGQVHVTQGSVCHASSACTGCKGMLNAKCIMSLADQGFTKPVNAVQGRTRTRTVHPSLARCMRANATTAAASPSGKTDGVKSMDLMATSTIVVHQREGQAPSTPSEKQAPKRHEHQELPEWGPKPRCSDHSKLLGYDLAPGGWATSSAKL